MKSIPSASILQHFSSLPDPRIQRGKRHELSHIFFIAICAVICGANDWVAIETYGKSKKSWFKKVLGLKNGIPSHDTFNHVFAVIDTQQFSECFSRWIADIATLSEGEVIAIDGKCLRRSIDTASKKAAIYIVSAWANTNQLVLSQQKVDDKSNEITAIPKLLNKMNISGAVITIDAMGCQTKIAERIVEKKADYLLSLKGNQGTLHEDVQLYFDSKHTCPEVGYETFDGEHGRFEKRAVFASSDIDWLKDLHPKWTGLKSIIAVTAERETAKKTSRETRYFISSLDATDPKRLGYIVRAHWGIENNLHWVLDTAFQEDDQRTRLGNSAANMAILRHIALNLIKSDKTIKIGIKNRRLKAGWDDEYMLQLMLSGQSLPETKT
jgi:predicted transposase YbfD/YdcC